MRKQIIEQSAHAVATQIRAVEDSIEAALMELAELQSRLIRARSCTGVAIGTGHEAFEEVAGALNGLVAARGRMGQAHVILLDAKNKIPGLRTVSFGDGMECPPASAHLRAVG
ncbi:MULTISPECIES: hypothetical protein [Sphingomonas]|uniref:hypothetical protein n=1 Tax=Sphingomonas TaxID=13687 RepID=UPI000DEEED77|nr:MULTISPECIES: hypothetical protein [Sphingomonas]